MIDQCKKEVIELHQFFEDWFNARLPDDEQSFSRLKSALSPDFLMITPQADTIHRDVLLKSLRSMNGHYLSKDQPSVIWIKNFNSKIIDKTHCILNYEEWQGSKNRSEGKGRLSSAVFEKYPEAPNGVRWTYLHETWLS